MGQDGSSIVSEETPPSVLSARSLSGLAEYIKSGKAKRVVVMVGAGISTAAGIPDFRSPDTGLYANLARLDLPYAEAVFDISYFRENPQPFYVLAKELYPGTFHPTITHVFIALLAAKGLLFQLFTQNIDCLERAAGVPSDLIVEAHGSFATQRCIDCGKPFPDARMREHVAKGEVPRCVNGEPNDGGKGCNGLVKPDIVFFGEALPKAFLEKNHLPATADLALVMGTSLQVHPFARLPDIVPEQVPRALFNLEQAGTLGSLPDDVVYLGDCDTGVRALADELGWRTELEEMWRGVVGDEEAERQLGKRRKGSHAMEDEVARLAQEVEDVLHVQDNGDKSDDATEDKHCSPHDGESVGKSRAGANEEFSSHDKNSATDESVSSADKLNAASKHEPAIREPGNADMGDDNSSTEHGSPDRESRRRV